MTDHFETLNLKPDASLSEVKASFRRLAKQYHPDSGGLAADSARFTEIHQAYRTLLGEMIHSGMAADSRFETPDQGAAGRDWRFEGVAEDGRNVIYVLRIDPRATTRGIKIDLPWRKEQACPHCFGQGHTLEGDKTGRRMNRIRCEKCDGGGVVTSDATLRVNLTPELLEHGRIRLNGRGHYYPREAIRGDLILEVSVDGNKKPDSSGMYSA